MIPLGERRSTHPRPHCVSIHTPVHGFDIPGQQRTNVSMRNRNLPDVHHVIRASLFSSRTTRTMMKQAVALLCLTSLVYTRHVPSVRAISLSTYLLLTSTRRLIVAPCMHFIVFPHYPLFVPVEEILDFGNCVHRSGGGILVPRKLSRVKIFPSSF